MSNLSAWKSTSTENVKSLDFRLKQEGYGRGLGLPGNVNWITFLPSILPILEYSSDINGGNPNKELELGSITLFGDEDLFRKKGIVAGIGVSGSGRAVYGQGKYLNYSMGSSYSYSPKHKIGMSKSFASLCSKNDVGKNYYLDGCLHSTAIDRDLASEVITSTSLNMAKLITDGNGRFHQASLGIGKYFTEEYQQNQISFKLDTFHCTGIYTSIKASFGEDVKNMHTMRHSLSAVVSTYFLKKPVNVFLHLSQSDGGRLLDVKRDETLKSINLTYMIHPIITLSLGYKNTTSNIDYFSEKGANFGIQFSPIYF